MVLERDVVQAATALNSSPVRSETEGIAEPLPTPMPGMNVGFSVEDLSGNPSPPQGQGTSFREASSYFGISVNEDSDAANFSEIVGEAQQLAEIAASPDSFTNSTSPTTAGDIMAIAALDEVEKARRHGNRSYRRGSSNGADGNGHFVQHPQPPSAWIDETACIKGPVDKTDPTSPCSSTIDIEHIVLEVNREVNAVHSQPTNQACLNVQVQAQMDLQQQAQLSTASHPQASTVNDTNLQPAHNAWGTHGSLYDGTGYGDDNSSISPRPSTSSAAPSAPPEAGDNTGYMAASFAQESDAMARDHATLEKVIRACAAFEEEGASGLSDEMIGDIVADVKLAEQMADHSLGA